MIEEEEENKDLLDYSVIKIVNAYLVDYFLFILIYVILITITIGYFFILSPKYKNIVKNNELYQNYKIKEITQLKEALSNYQDYQNIYNAISLTDKEKINNFLPDHNDSEELLIYIRNMMTRGGFQLLSLEIGDIVGKKVNAGSNQSAVKKENIVDAGNVLESEKISSIDISMSVGKLNYSSVKKLLSFIARDARFFDVQNVEFSLTEGTMNLKLKTYYLK